MIEVFNSQKLTDLPNSKEDSVSPLESKVSEQALSRLNQPELQGTELRKINVTELSLSKDCKARNSPLWNCIGRKLAPHGGFIYEFKLKDEYNTLKINYTGKTSIFGDSIVDRSAERAVRAIQDKIFPAVDPAPRQALWLDPDANVEELKEFVPSEELDSFATDQQEDLNFYLTLGFRGRVTKEGVYLFAPDREAFTANWEELRRTDPSYPPLNVQSSDGIATDDDFSRAYIIDDVIVLSKGVESLHDSFAHLKAIVELIRKSPVKYVKHNARIREIAGAFYNRIQTAKEVLKNNSINAKENEVELVEKHIEKLDAILGSLIDELRSYPDHWRLKQITDKTFSVNSLTERWTNSRWERYFTDRFKVVPSRIEREIKSTLQILEKRSRNPGVN